MRATIGEREMEQEREGKRRRERDLSRHNREEAHLPSITTACGFSETSKIGSIWLHFENLQD
jgi:hypothetical protein